ncbi:efflux transporter outer membrane subunit [Sphingobacterium sp. WOUb80]|jgi:NodT family efflux transporter outer membrane factor (OMF) lipoprotein|uniref:efflux transporter outer membrane subunit n=2 Tax=unclassified Sphingobacterium TaxID=2609468 RepID=UPI003CEB5900
MYKMEHIKSTAFAALLIILLLGSCSVQQAPKTDLALPASFDNVAAVADSSVAKMTYKDFFKDPVLVELIDRGMAKNNDLQVAMKQIDIAAEGFKQSKWLYAPLVNATLANASINRPSNNSMNGMMASQFMGQSYTTDYTSAINISWELDIWGKLKAQKQDAVIELLKTKEAANAVKTRLVAEIVQAYYNLLMLDKQLAITKENLSFADSTWQILVKQQSLGMTTALAVQQQFLVKEQVSKRIPDIEGAIAIQENALNVLVGNYPRRIEREKGLDDVYVPQQLTAGIPAALLSFRPDVRSKELDLRKSYLGVHIARVSMYPGLNITAQGGLNSFKASNWFTIPGALFGTAAGAITQPIFNGRQLKTKYEQSKIMAEQAEIQFKQAVLVGVAEVSDALVKIQKLDEQRLIAGEVIKQSREIVDKSLLLYKYNEGTYLEVIIAQTNRLQAEIDLATVQAQKLNSIAMLYRSLGGGWL